MLTTTSRSFPRWLLACAILATAGCGTRAAALACALVEESP